MQPVGLTDLLEAIGLAVTRSVTASQSYDVSSGEALSYVELMAKRHGRWAQAYFLRFLCPRVSPDFGCP